MATDDHITLIVEGLPEDDGQVRLAAFLSELQTRISQVDRSFSASAARLWYKYQYVELVGGRV